VHQNAPTTNHNGRADSADHAIALVCIGVYIDGFDLYYGARGLCGRWTPGWRWLDLRALAADLAGRRSNWAGAQVHRVVYCTARIDGASNPSGQANQDVYLKALVAAGSVDHIEYGTYDGGDPRCGRGTWCCNATAPAPAGTAITSWDPSPSQRGCREHAHDQSRQIGSRPASRLQVPGSRVADGGLVVAIHVQQPSSGAEKRGA
jgi:hypothetical protein